MATVTGMGSRSWASVGAVAATVLVAAGCGAPEAPRLGMFDRPATAQDAIHDDVVVGDARETRYVGEAGDGLVYAAQGSADEPLCVLVALAPLEGSDWTTASSCTDDEHFADSGVWVSATGVDGRGGAALLLPDNFAGDVDETKWRVVEPNLAVSLES